MITYFVTVMFIANNWMTETDSSGQSLSNRVRGSMKFGQNQIMQSCTNTHQLIHQDIREAFWEKSVLSKKQGFQIEKK